VVVDDCSTDETASIVERYVEAYPSAFRFIRRRTNGMLSAARNSGLREVQGEWITFLDGDDWLAPEACGRMLRGAQDSNADIVACSYYHAWSNGHVSPVNPFGELDSASPHRLKVALMRNHACTRLYKRQFLDAMDMPFPEGIARAAEMGLTIPLLSHTDRIVILNEPLYYYYQRSDSNSNSSGNLTDFRFFEQSLAVMKQNMATGFDEEYDFHAILELLYSRNLVFIRSGVAKGFMKRSTASFLEEYPLWRDNKYIPYLERRRKVFMILASRDARLGLRILDGAQRALGSLRQRLARFERELKP
jgi:glycosyltransferase involved in cell wall biosynthesis